MQDDHVRGCRARDVQAHTGASTRRSAQTAFCRAAGPLQGGGTPFAGGVLGGGAMHAGGRHRDPDAARQLAELQLAVGRAPEATATLRAAAARQPLTDEALLLFGRALEASGKDAEALQQYQRYQQADVFCLPSAETYGIALLEAVSCACAVIVSDCNGPGEIVNDAIGLKVPVRRPEQFIYDYARAIVELARNPDLRMTFAQRARRNVVLNHDWGKIGEQLLTIYETYEDLGHTVASSSTHRVNG